MADSFVSNVLEDKLSKYIIEVLSKTIKLPVDMIDSEMPLENFGLDSLLVMQLTGRLEEDFGTLSKTLFYEYETIKELSLFFLQTYTEETNRLFGQSPILEDCSDDNQNMEAREAQVVGQSRQNKNNNNKSGGKVEYIGRKRGFQAINISAKNPPEKDIGKSNASMNNDSKGTGDIAIIGLYGKYPKSKNMDEFWYNLVKGTDCVTEIPEERWDYTDLYSDNHEKGRIDSKWGGFIDDVDKFDARFFKISPKEAKLMDPQERIFLEGAYAVIEDAGYTPKRLKSDGSKIGVYVGVVYEEYQLLGVQEQDQGNNVGLTGSPSSIANRVSYYFDLNGPSMGIDTMCSSSLTAIHLACQSIRNGECGYALAGGVNLSIHKNKYLYLSQNRFLSTKGRCESFGEGGDGYVPAEGVGIVLLKPLEEAEKDHDNIYGIIKGTAVNHGGRANGFTVPNPRAQTGVIKEAIKDAGIEANTISYIEAHGTGTSLGDPIEIAALAKAYGMERMANQSCPIGSVKSNIGHCESAAGMAGLSKILYQMKYNTIVPSLHSKTLNSFINFSETPFYVPQQCSVWDKPSRRSGNEQHELPKRAALSSFGAGGSNAHLIVEEYEKKPGTVHPDRMPAIFVLSARNQDTLINKIKDLALFCEDQEHRKEDLASIAYTLQVGREKMSCRVGFVASSHEELLEKLNQAAKCVSDNKGTAGICFKKSSQDSIHSKSRESAHSLAVNGEYETIVCSWVDNDEDMEWNQIYTGNLPDRISLPTYPFERKRHWITEPIIKNKKICESSSNQSLNQIADEDDLLFLREIWVEKTPAKFERNKGETIVFFYASVQQREVMKGLSGQDGSNIIYVEQGQEHFTEDTYSIDFKKYEDYRKLFLQIQETGVDTIDKIYFAYNLEAMELVDNYESVFQLIKALGLSGVKCKDFIIIGIFSNKKERAFLNSLVGFERSSRFVLPETTIHIIMQDGCFNNREWLTRLWDEPYQEDRDILFEKNKRMVPQIVVNESDSNGKEVLKVKGTYMITGGLGALGMIFATWFATNYQANLVLINRSVLNDKTKKNIKLLEGLGSEVLYIKADVSDLMQMKLSLDLVKDRFGRIDGLIHAAGLEGRKNLKETDFGDFKSVILPKIKGTLVMEEVMDNENLDFICHFSSSSAIMGDFGSCDYAVANRFIMDTGNAEKFRSHGTHYRVINWPLWDSEGMGFSNSDSTKLYLKSTGQHLLTAAEGVDIFHNLINGTMENLFLLKGNRETLSRQFKLVLTASKKNGLIQQPVLSGETIIRTTCIIESLTEMIESVLKMETEDIEPDENLADFGFDSVTLSELAGLISELYSIRVTPDVLFSYPTIEKLATYLQDNYKEQLLLVHENTFAKSTAVNSMTANFVETKKEEMPHIPESYADVINQRPQVAVIGMSGKFPACENVDEFWRLLVEGKDAISIIPDERWEIWKKCCGLNDYDQKDVHIGTVTNPFDFDPYFFESSPAEAEETDPRQRLLLEEMWKALEVAGYSESLINDERIGVFLGLEDGDYAQLSGAELGITSNHNAITAARMAYFLNLDGPNLAINTACSSGLVAFHQACLSIENGECDTAVVGAANLMLSGKSYMAMKRAGMLSAKGICTPFDESADGMIPSEAVAVVVLKRADKAISDKQPIYATVKGSGINFDGKTTGITAPSRIAQTKLLKDVYKKNNIAISQVQYLVTHGTATKIGDPIEINGLGDVFHGGSQTKQCAITSAKGNMGHTLAASGLVSLISLVEAFEREVIPSSIHCHNPNEYIDWNHSPLYINQENQEWQNRGSELRIGAVSAFGMSGTNAHIVLESNSSQKSRDLVLTEQQSFPYYILPLSAKTQKAMKTKWNMLLSYFEENEIDSGHLASISYTLIEGRFQFKFRSAIVVGTREEAIHALKDLIKGKDSENSFLGQVERKFTAQASIQEMLRSSLAAPVLATTTPETYYMNLCGIAELYCLGYEIPGKEIFDGNEPFRVKLPTYPFENDAFIILAEANKTPMNTLPSEDVMLVCQWEPITLQFKKQLSDKKGLIVYYDDNDFSFFKGQFSKSYGYKVTGTDADEERLSAVISKTAHLDEIVWISPTIKKEILDYDVTLDNEIKGVSLLFCMSKELMNHGYKTKQLGLTFITKDALMVREGSIISPDYAGVHGFAGALEKEVPRWSINAIDIAGNVKLDHRYSYLPENISGFTLAWRDDNWYTQNLIKVDSGIESGSQEPVYLDEGVYLVIGGAGGIGTAWSRRVIQSVNAQVIWMGRHELNDAIYKKMASLSEYGKQPLYIQGDASVKADVERVRNEIITRFGRIDGIVHSAVGELDERIENLNKKQLKEILNAKISSSVIVTQVFSADKPKLNLFFSSIASFTRPGGQVGYSTGSTFLDSFALRLSQEGDSVVKILNWGFWGSIGIGMKMPESYKKRILLTGMKEIEPEKAMKDLERIICLPYRQIAYMRGNPEGVQSLIRVEENNKNLGVVKDGASKGEVDLSGPLTIYLKNILERVLKYSQERIDEEANLSEYGIDSIIIVQLTELMKKDFKDISETIFFECQTIKELRCRLMELYEEEVHTLFLDMKEEMVLPAEPVKEGETVKSLDNVSPDKSDVSVRGDSQDIAVIGMSCRFPQANNVEEYWKVLSEGIDCITEIPKDRWRLEGFYLDDMEEAIAQDKSYCKWGGFVEGVDEFDPLFFKISPREALAMDPQERIFLQECWKTFEDAGYTRQRIKDQHNGNVGVFAGVTRTGYELYGPTLWEHGDNLRLSTNFSSIANRVSFIFDLHGPSMPIDTMCSASLSAIHEASRHIRDGECEMALAGGVNIYTHPSSYLRFCKERMLSPAGRCKTFGDNADGFVPGEGVGVILLKSLNAAQRDGDHIYAVIKGSAINHGGKTNGYTVPNPNSQRELISTAINRSGVCVRNIGYIEAHGTGTALGDPIELTGLTNAFRAYTEDKQFCSIGSVKTNIGHLEAASGVAGVIKCILQMNHKMLVPSLHSKPLSKRINFSDSPFYVQQNLAKWDNMQAKSEKAGKLLPRIAGVSAFGAGGSNAHVILEEYV